MAGVVDFAQLGGIIPKTVTRQPRTGNPPPRTVETRVRHAQRHRPRQRRHRPFHSPSSAVSADAADRDHRQHRRQDTSRSSSTWRRSSAAEPGLAALELNLSCPNVAGGVDFATDPEVTRRVVQRRARRLPAAAHRQADAECDRHRAHRPRRRRMAGADAVSLVNTFVGMAIDWRRRRPILGNVDRRPERAGDQAAGAAAGLAGRPAASRCRSSASAASPRSTM